MRRGLFFFSWLFFGPVLGAEVQGLYQAQTPVEGKNSAAQAKAIETALGLVLVKLSADPGAAARPEAKSLLKNARTYIQEYAYLDTPADNPPSGSQLQLRAVFEPQALQRAMKNAGIRVWGRERPTVLVWLATQEGGVSQLIGTNHPSGYSAALDAEAAQLGLPLMWPLLDLEDESLLTSSSLAAGQEEAILTASLRYPADAILAGNLAQPTPERWEVHWTLYFNGKAITSWTSSGTNPQTALNGGIDGAAHALAAQYVKPFRPMVEERIELLVEGISTAEDYTRVQRYLGSLEPVQELRVERLESSRAWFSVMAQGGVEVLHQSIALGRTLQAISPEEGRYQLLPEY